ncbi:hypothetical protein [Paenibacillus sp. 2TAB26]|uniref:hypothetical protein n=1 Tax=Paenibacillus sp. 2TAB26 TaxID=3233005 RepID=UPI003F95F18E
MTKTTFTLKYFYTMASYVKKRVINSIACISNRINRSESCDNCDYLDRDGLDPEVLGIRILSYSISHYLESEENSKNNYFLLLQHVKNRYELLTGTQLRYHRVAMFDYRNQAMKDLLIPSKGIVDAYQLAANSGLNARPLSIRPC